MATGNAGADGTACMPPAVTIVPLSWAGVAAVCAGVAENLSGSRIWVWSGGCNGSLALGVGIGYQPSSSRGLRNQESGVRSQESGVRSQESGREYFFPDP